MSNDPSKKIIVDEDWKHQVEAEREALRQKEEAQAAAAKSGQPSVAATPAAEAAAPSATETAAAAAEKPAAGPRPQQRPLPPPDLVYLAGTLYMQALVSLGLIPNPVTKQAAVNWPQARHAIDCLEVLRAKTEGNRTTQETEAIDQMLHELRMTFIECQTPSSASGPGGA